MHASARSLTAMLLVLGLAAPSYAQDAEHAIQIHGFGGWVYGRTSNNVYLAGTPDGDYRLVHMAGSLSKAVDEHISIHVQGEVTEDDDATDLQLSYAFVDYFISDRLSVRIGQVKHPFGIYNEVFAVGTLRPFLDLPQAFYGPVGFAGESYKGVGLAGNVEMEEWNVAYDLYGGGNDLRKFAAPEEYYLGSSLTNVAKEVELQSTRNVIGGRLVVRTPVQGFTIGGSSYTGILNEPAANRRTVVAGQIGYRTNTVTLESELAHEDQTRDEQAMGGYALAAYRLSPEWQVAVQYDALTNRFFGADTLTAPSLQHHREGALAVSRWFSRALVVKAEYHLVSGNRFALPNPEDLVSTIAAGRLRTTTHLFQFGAQFSY
jgi:Phosphate-selective porin O and P